MAETIRTRAVQFAKTVIMRSADWQDVQHALADHDEFGPWLEREFGDDAASEAQSIIRQAEEALGGRMPAGYA